jgi:MFS family permease
MIVIYNLAQIYRAINDNVFDASTNTMLVAFTGLGSAVGRILSGAAERTLTKRHMVVTTLFPFSPIVISLGLFLFQVLPVGTLLVPFTMVSVGFGANWATTVMAVRQMFKTDTGAHYNFSFLGIVTAMIVLNKGLFGSQYDKQGKVQGIFPECSGLVCVSLSLWVMAALNLVAIVAAFVLHWLWRRRVNQYHDGTLQVE